VIVAVMFAWMLQWYGYVLFVIGKVKRNESPAAREPESKPVEFEVTVWVTAPMLLQQTVAPSGTV